MFYFLNNNSLHLHLHLNYEIIFKMILTFKLGVLRPMACFGGARKSQEEASLTDGSKEKCKKQLSADLQWQDFSSDDISNSNIFVDPWVGCKHCKILNENRINSKIVKGKNISTSHLNTTA